jgi:hypothetical protein
MRARHRSKSNSQPSRQSKKVDNGGSFNVFCIAIAVLGDSHTEPCQSEYND